jgi:hypothetical protein
MSSRAKRSVHRAGRRTSLGTWQRILILASLFILFFLALALPMYREILGLFTGATVDPGFKVPTRIPALSTPVVLLTPPGMPADLVETKDRIPWTGYGIEVGIGFN